MPAFNSYTTATTAGTSDTQLIWQGGQVKQLALPYSWDGTTLTLPQISMGGEIHPSNDTAAIRFPSNLTVGMYGGGQRLYIQGGTTAAFQLNDLPYAFKLANNLQIGWTNGGDAMGTEDTILLRDAAGVLALRNGTNAQALRVYGFCADNSNYSRLSSLTNDGGVNRIKVEEAGTGVGTSPNLSLEASSGGFVGFVANGTEIARLSAMGLLFPEDNTYDIGAPTSGRPHEINVAYSINVGSFINVGDGGIIIFNDGTVLSNGVAIFNAFQFRGKSTPSSSSDSSGAGGEMWSDNDYIYLKTDSGWKRVALSTF